MPEQTKMSVSSSEAVVWIYPEATTIVPQVVQQLKAVQEVNAHLTADEVEQMQDPNWHGPSLVVHGASVKEPGNDPISIQDMGPGDEKFVRWETNEDADLAVESSRLIASHPSTTTYYVPRLALTGFSACLRDFDVSPLGGVLPFRTLYLHIDRSANSPSEVADCAKSFSRLVRTIGGLSKIQVSPTDFNLCIIERWLGGGGDGFSGEIELIDVSRELLTWATATRVLSAIYQQHKRLIAYYSGKNNSSNENGDGTRKRTRSDSSGNDGNATTRDEAAVREESTNSDSVPAENEPRAACVHTLTVSTIRSCAEPQAPLEFTSMLMKIAGIHPSFQVRFPSNKIVLNAVDPPCVPSTTTFTLPRWRDLLPQLAGTNPTAASAALEVTTTKQAKEGGETVLGLYICGRVVYCEAQIILANSGLLRRLFADVKDDESAGGVGVSDKDEDGVSIVPILMDRTVALYTVQLMVCFLTECVLKPPEAAEDNPEITAAAPANHEGHKKSRNLALFTDTMLGDSVREKKLNLCELIALATYLDIDVVKNYARAEFLRLLAC